MTYFVYNFVFPILSSIGIKRIGKKKLFKNLGTSHFRGHLLF